MPRSVLGGVFALARRIAIALLDPAARAPFAGLMPLAAAVMMLMVVGVADDIFSLAALPRLALQAVAVGAAVATLPAELHALPVVPLAVERGVEIVAMLWFVNLVNFMDGIDWITVAETVPITAGLLILALLGAVPSRPSGQIGGARRCAAPCWDLLRSTGRWRGSFSATSAVSRSD